MTARTRPIHRSIAASRRYRPAVTPGLRRALIVVFVLIALIGANSLYLVTVTVLENLFDASFQNYFYQYMFLGHLVLGLLLLAPFLVFGIGHMANTRRRKNRTAVRIGYALFAVALTLLLTGLLLTRAGPLEIRSPNVRRILYWLHVIAPLVSVWLYWLHRLAGPPIRWRWGLGYLAAAVFASLAMVGLHNSDPRPWNQIGPREGVQYFAPSLARTSTGRFLSERVLMNDQYCAVCHPDSHADWSESAHRFSSFNNPAYLVSVRETRAVALRQDGQVQRARFCAGCHDPIPFFAGRFDDPHYDDVKDPTAHAGITCTVCHAITNINSPRGNADYTIEEPLHYPFALSNNPFLQWVNHQLVKAKPAFHQRTFLKPLHRSTEFCSVCHKVHLPETLNDYKFLRGQNHHDSFLLSGVSGHGARSFYYPQQAERNCNGCHMPLRESADFGAQVFPGSPRRRIHDHLFLGANTALPYWRGKADVIAAHQQFLRDCMRVDLFALREGGTIDGRLLGPLRPTVPIVQTGQRYLLDVVIRTLKLGHHFTQGTSDSNEIWLEVVVTSGDRLLGQSGKLQDDGQVDPWAHFVNAFVLDRDGHRIDRRNAQDIFVPLYDHQIPPGAAQTVHYSLPVPSDLRDPIEIEVRLQYRKFDQTYLQIVAQELGEQDPSIGAAPHADDFRNDLPITTLAADRIVLPVAEGPPVDNYQEPDIPEWQRWNDYGIGLLLKGKAQLRQATEAFAQVERLGRYDGPLNLARAHYAEGQLDEATADVRRASAVNDPPTPAWTLAWLSGLINREQGRLREAEMNFRSILQAPTAAQSERGLDFRLDYEIINLLGQTLYERARSLRGTQNDAARGQLFQEAVQWFQQTLILDPENVTAHYNLQLLYAALGDADQSAYHRQQHQQYKVDDNARDRAVAAARKRYPAANHAAEAVVIYDLGRETLTESDTEGHVSSRENGSGRRE